MEEIANKFGITRKSKTNKRRIYKFRLDFAHNYRGNL